jgi:hypothetical protein
LNIPLQRIFCLLFITMDGMNRILKMSFTAGRQKSGRIFSNPEKLKATGLSFEL